MIVLSKPDTNLMGCTCAYLFMLNDPSRIFKVENPEINFENYPKLGESCSKTKKCKIKPGYYIVNAKKNEKH
jgi:hypothetical protein